MQCNLNSHEGAPVVLSFHDEVHNAQLYELSNTANLPKTRNAQHKHTKFQRNRTIIPGGVIAI